MTQLNSSSSNRFFTGQSRAGQFPRECLSPLPLDNGRPVILRNRFIRVNSAGMLSLMPGSGGVIPLQLMIILFLSIFFVFGGMAVKGLFDGGMVLAIMPLAICILWTLTVYGYQSDILEDTEKSLPMIFNPQKQQMFISWFDKVKQPEIMSGGSDFRFLCSIGAFMCISVGLSIIFLDSSMSGGWITFFIGLCLSYIPAKPWIKYLRDKKAASSNIYMSSVPWENVRIEYQETLAISLIGPGVRRFFNITVQVPEDNNRIHSVTFGVLSREEALSTFQLIRDYMENGANGIQYTKAAELETLPGLYSRQAYKEQIAIHQKNKVFLEHLAWRIFNIVTLKYLAHWYAEYLYDVLPRKNKRLLDAMRWCESIPTSDWVFMSDELKEANDRVRALYARGYRWEDEIVQSVIREYDDITAGKHDFE